MSQDDFFKIRSKQAPVEAGDEEKKSIRPHGPVPKRDFAKLLAKQEKKDGEENSLIDIGAGPKKEEKKPSLESLAQKFTKEGHDPRTNQPPALTKESKVPPKLGSNTIDAPSDEPRSKPFIETLQTTKGEKPQIELKEEKPPALFAAENPKKSSKEPVSLSKDLEKTEAQNKQASKEPKTLTRSEQVASKPGNEQELQGRGGVNLEEQKKQLEADQKALAANRSIDLNASKGQKLDQTQKFSSEAVKEKAQEKVQEDTKQVSENHSVFTFKNFGDAVLTPAVNPTTHVQHPEKVLELIQTLAAEIQTHQTKENTTAVIKIQKEGLFQGAEISITSFTQARGEVNIELSNLTQEAKNLLDLNVNLLRSALEDRGIVVHMLVTTTAASNQIATPQSQSFKEQKEQSQGDQREGQNSQEQEEESK